MNIIPVTSIEIAEKCGSFRDELNFRIKFKMLRSLRKDVEWDVYLELDGGEEFCFHLGGKKTTRPKKDSYTLNFRVGMPEKLDVPYKYLRAKGNICIEGAYGEGIFHRKDIACDIYYEDPDMNLMPPPCPIMEKLMWKIIPDDSEQENEKVEEQETMSDDSDISMASSSSDDDDEDGISSEEEVEMDE